MPRTKKEGTRVWLPATLGQELAGLAEQFDLSPADPVTIINYLLGFVAIAGIKKGESVVLSRPTRAALSTLAQHWGIDDDPALIVGCMVGFFMLRVDIAAPRDTPDSTLRERDDELVFDIDWDS